MGAWNAKINGNDTFRDIYQLFFNFYNKGHKPIDISIQIQKQMAEMFNDYEEGNNCLFALALAQWETKSLNPIIFKKVKEIIDTGKDIELWKELDAEEKVLRKREKELGLFLSQISTEREKPKRRSRAKLEFNTVEIVNISSPDNLKIFDSKEEYTNKSYIHTSGFLNWPHPTMGGIVGRGILYYTLQGNHISAKWLDNNTLEITHDKYLEFSVKEETIFCHHGDVTILYKIL